MEISQLQIVHEALADGRWEDAANLALAADDLDLKVNGKEEALKVLKTLEKNLLEDDNYTGAAVLLWGNGMFDSRPSTVQTVFRAVHDFSKLIIFGASSTSKTFSAGVYFYLEWRRDPYWTAVKMAAVNEDHLYGNLFSHLVALHRAALLPMTEDDENNIEINETEMFISMHDALPEMRIKGVLCKQNQLSAGALRGHKPKPYRKPLHPKFGNSSRLRILIDEASQVSPGAFEDLKTSEASINGLDTVKIVIALNPEDVSSKVVQMAEPPEGWSPEQVDVLYEWEGKSGYHVIRLDGKRFENVVQRKIIYKNMLSYESFLDFLKAGEHSASYWAKGRGFPPLKDSAYTIVPPGWLQTQRGEPRFISHVRNIAILDTALQGSDKALMGIGRFGEAAGWMDFKGEMHWFEDRLNPAKRKPRHVAVLDQIIQLPKYSTTVEVAQEVMGRCNQLGIAAEDCVLDRTGNAAGVWSHLVKFWGNVLGVDFGTKASEEKVIAEDLQTAYDIYDGKVTELWYAMKRWLDPTICALLLNPIVPTQPIFTQLTTRRYRSVKGGRVRVEPKDEWKALHGGISPDEADIFCLFVEFIRQKCGVIPGVQEQRAGERRAGNPNGAPEQVSLQQAEETPPLRQDEWVGGQMQQE